MDSNKLSPLQFFKPNKDLEQIAHYKILSELGAGGMGKVYKAFDPQMNRTVAIKVILPGKASTKAYKRFMAEAKTMAQFRHPNIVTVYDVATDTTGLDYIVMDFIEGEDLTNKSLPLRQALNLIKDAALAIDYAHQQGIIHRDLKPANLMLTNKDSKIVVMDFGLAKNLKADDITQSGTVIGTPRYMAPEQADGRTKEVSAKTDVYALGALLYELLAGVPAIAGVELAQILNNIFYKEMVPLQKHKPQMAIELGIICTRAMAREMDQRYSSARAFAEDIERFLQGEVIQAQAFPLWYWILKKIKKHRVAVVIIALSLLALVGGVYAFSVQQNKKAATYLQQGKILLMKLPEINTLSDAKKFAHGKRIDRTLEAYVKVLDPLQKVHEQANKLLLLVYKRIGLLALTKKNYILSQSAFKGYKRLGGKEDLLQLLKQEENADVKRVETIMAKLEGYQFQEEQLKAWEVEILRMKHPKVVRKLLSYVKSKKWQRLLAYRTLGKLGDKTTKVDDKDSVTWLLERLKVLDPVKDDDEVGELIWALGWLRDVRAEDLVKKKRCQAGRNGLLWRKTKLPYRWIPFIKGKLYSAIAYNDRGDARSDKGDQDGAIDDFNQALKLNPNYVKAYNGRGGVRQMKGDLDGAIVDYNQALKLNPKFAKAYNNRGLVKQMKGELDSAIADYNRALKFNPRSTNAYSNRGSARKAKGDLDGAIADYNQALIINPKHASVYCNRAIARMAKRDLDGAIDDFNQALNLNSKYVKAYHGRGNIRHIKGDLDGAIDDYTQTIKLNPKSTNAYSNRGVARKSKGDLDGAIDDYTQAIQLNSKHASAYKNRGLAFREKKQYKQMIVDFRNYLILRPNSSQASQILMYIRKHSK